MPFSTENQFLNWSCFHRPLDSPFKLNMKQTGFQGMAELCWLSAQADAQVELEKLLVSQLAYAWVSQRTPGLGSLVFSLTRPNMNQMPSYLATVRSSTPGGCTYWSVTFLFKNVSTAHLQSQNYSRTHVLKVLQGRCKIP